MEQFEYKNLFEKKKMQLSELCDYYRRLRKYEYETGVPLKGLKMRDRLYKLCMAIIRLDRELSHETIEVLSDDRIPSDKPKLFACTHIGGNDIQRVFETIGEHAYLFLGDPGDTYVNITGVLIYMNGSINLETRDKDDRKIAYNRAVELLNTGRNLVIFPEGAWDVYENLPVMGLYNGTARMAIETGADIIPVALEQYGPNFKIKIGKNISTSSDMSFDALTEHLKEVLGTLKYEIWESEPLLKREPSKKSFLWEGVSVSEQERLIKNLYEPFRESIVHKEELGYVLQDVYDTMYRRDETTADSLIAEIRERLEKDDETKKQDIYNMIYRENDTVIDSLVAKNQTSLENENAKRMIFLPKG